MLLRVLVVVVFAVLSSFSSILSLRVPSQLFSPRFMFDVSLSFLLFFFFLLILLSLSSLFVSFFVSLVDLNLFRQRFLTRYSFSPCFSRLFPQKGFAGVVFFLALLPVGFYRLTQSGWTRGGFCIFSRSFFLPRQLLAESADIFIDYSCFIWRGCY